MDFNALCGRKVFTLLMINRAFAIFEQIISICVFQFKCLSILIPTKLIASLLYFSPI